MRFRLNILLLTSLCLVLSAAPRVRADSQEDQGAKIKAAFAYNFMKFVEWPPEKMGDANTPVVVGLIGAEEFAKALEPVTRKKVHNKNISLKYFAGYEKLRKPQEADEEQWNQKIKVLKGCHVLLFCNCNSVRIENSVEMIKALRDSPVLTVGEEEDILKFGGMINFVMEDNKVRFEINAAAVKKGKLKMSSKLLRLAKRVVEEESPQ